MEDKGPFEILKAVIGYAVTIVWVVMFLTALWIPPKDPAVYLSVQAVMMVVAGSLYADKLIRRNGKKDA